MKVVVDLLNKDVVETSLSGTDTWWNDRDVTCPYCQEFLMDVSLEIGDTEETEFDELCEHCGSNLNFNYTARAVVEWELCVSPVEPSEEILERAFEKYRYIALEHLGQQVLSFA